MLLFNLIVTESLFVNEPQNPFHVIVTESLFVNEPQNPFLITVSVNMSLKMYSFMQKSSFYGTWVLPSPNTCLGSDCSTKKKKEPQKSPPHF